MELKQVPVYKNHGYRACISAAFSFFSDNIKIVLSHTWMYAAAFSLLISVSSVLFPSSRLLYSMILENPYIVIGVAVVMLLFFVAQLVFHSSIMSLLTCRSVMWNIWRNFKAVVSVSAVVMCLSAVFTAIAFLSVRHSVDASQIYKAMFLAVGILMLLVLIFALPFVYGMMKYIMEPETKLRQMFTGFYVAGPKHWGFLFVILVTVILFVCVSSHAVMLPAIIMSFAANVSEAGVIEYGDADGLPAYFPYMFFIITFITSFISLYINTIVIFAAYYIYGSVNVREEMTKTKNAKK